MDCESEGAAGLQGARDVASLEAKGKMAAASAKLQPPPLGMQFGASMISNTGRVTEQLFFLETIWRVLDIFFAWPVVQVAMTEHLRLQAGSTYDKNICGVIAAVRGSFTGPYTPGTIAPTSTRTFPGSCRDFSSP